MSTSFALAMSSPNSPAGSAPAWEYRTTFSRNTIRVGIERMLKAAAISCSSSVFTFAKTMSSWASDAFSKMGAKPRHGPHHGAQKSITTMGLSVTTCSKFSLVSSTVAMLAPFWKA